MALNGEEGRRRTNNERVERSTAASETSLEMYVRVGVTEWKVETRRRAHEVGGRGSEHEEGPRHRFRVLLLQLGCEWLEAARASPVNSFSGVLQYKTNTHRHTQTHTHNTDRQTGRLPLTVVNWGSIYCL